MTPPLMPESFVDPGHRYRVDSRIATGGMGVVWRGTDTVLSRPVAIKVLKPEYADDATFRRRFETEARHAAALQHPGVAAVYDFGEGPDPDVGAYLVMELVDGRPLSELLRPGAPMDPEVARDIIAQAADAIGAAHRAGIVHRDVKPGNLLISTDRRVKITDFGIARAADGVAHTATGTVLGTPHYLSPEQARGETAGTASDVYSLAVVLYECLAGRKPFAGDSPITTALAHLREEPPPLPDGVPADLRQVVARGLAKDPSQRFADAAEFARALRDPGSIAPPVGTGAAPIGPDEEASRTQVLAAPGEAGASRPGAEVVGAAGAVPAMGQSFSYEEPESGDLEPGTHRATGAPPEADSTRGDDGRNGGGRSEDDRKRGFGWGWVVAAVLLVAIVFLIGFQVLGGTGGDSGDDASSSSSPTQSDSTSPSATATRTSSSASPTESSTSESPTMVEVDPDDWVGRPIQDVTLGLQDLGLKVSANELPNDGSATENDVESLSPNGQVEIGTTITVNYWGAASATSTPSETPTETPTETDSATSSPTETTSGSQSGGGGGGGGGGNLEPGGSGS